MVQNVLNFTHFFGKIDKIVCWRPPPSGGSAPPPVGNPGSTPGNGFTIVYLRKDLIVRVVGQGNTGSSSQTDGHQTVRSALKSRHVHFSASS